MKKEKTAKKARKLIAIIVVLSIICLILISLIPWISVRENDFVKEDLHFNLAMIWKSDNEHISNLVNDLNIINISFWTLIILGLLSFIGATIYASGKFSVLGYILLLVGCITFIFSILVIYFQLVMMDKIGKIDTIYVSAILSPFNYAYILIIPNILILIFSAFYTWTMSLHSMQKLKVLKEGKKDKKIRKKKNKKIIKKVSKTREKEPLIVEELKEETSEPKKKQPFEEEIKKEKIVEPIIDEKRKEIEQLLTGEVVNMDKQAVKENPSEQVEKDQEIAIIKQPSLEEKSSDIEAEQKISPEPQKESKEIPVFPSEKTKVKTKKLDEVRASQSFEKALISVIPKKQTNIEKPELLKAEDKEVEVKTEEKEEIPSLIEEPANKKFNVRCPQCKQIFTAEKEEEIIKIKCPKCGKDGVIK